MPQTNNIGVLFESLTDDKLGERCSERGCIYPAETDGRCRMHHWIASNPGWFTRQQVEIKGVAEE